MTRLLAVAAVFVAAGPAYPDVPPMSQRWDTTFGARKGCDHTHRSSVAYKRLRALVRHTRPSVNRQRVRHYAICLETRAKAHRAHVLARRFWAWRHAYPQVYRILLMRNYSWTLGWLASTRACESGGNYGAISPGGTYRGAYQFDYGTWAEVGGSGDPAAAHPWEQDYRAAKLYSIAGDGRWPVCGH